MNRLYLLLGLALCNISVQAHNPPQSNDYQYFVDLVNVEDDRIAISLVTPQISEEVINFYLPKIIPGTYTVYDFGRFADDLQAYDDQGNTLPVVRQDDNTWEIQQAQQLYKITYWVNDSFDAGGGNPVSGMSGTNIEANQNFLINGHGFFGYLEGMKEYGFKVEYQKPEGFFGATPLTPTESDRQRDAFFVSNYFQLVDNPIMYARPDTAVVRVAETDVLVAVYSPSGNIQADYIAERYATLLKAQEAYLGGELPVDRYAFLMYFYDPDESNIGSGALEHNYSSVYYLPDLPQDQIIQFLVDIAAHEFFHIVTPLNVHSEEIHYFDFNDPDMSQHLWMYEGVTEYFAHHAQVRGDLISTEDFLATMGQKIQQSQTLYEDDLPFTELSSECLGEHSAQYGNVYEKGALIGMCLDIELLRTSNGTYGLVDLMHDLSERFGTEEPFRDQRLFRAIRQLTNPTIKRFLRKYVDGPNPLPYAEFLANVGVDYVPPAQEMVFTLGNINLGYRAETQQVYVANTYGMNEFGHAMGYQVGDVFLSINGLDVPKEGINAYFNGIMESLVEGEPITIEVGRTQEDGEEEKVTLSATARRVPVFGAPELQLNENATPAQIQLRNAWLGL